MIEAMVFMGLASLGAGVALGWLGMLWLLAQAATAGAAALAVHAAKCEGVWGSGCSGFAPFGVVVESGFYLEVIGAGGAGLGDRTLGTEPGVTGLPEVRGVLTPDRSLADLTWMRVGGPADWLFQPADLDDLTGFLKALDPGVAIFPIGVGSNLIVRDGGLRAVVIRLGRGFNGVTIDGGTVRAGAAAPDSLVARKAAEAGLDLTFLRTIPGTIGGAVKMNAGCYGTYTADRFIGGTAVTRAGAVVRLGPADLAFGYRQSALRDDHILIEAEFAAPSGDPEALATLMADQVARRDATQPVRDRTAGSTFRNPAGYSSTGRADDSHALKAWKVIDDAGLRGARQGGAVMNEKHPNFLTNAGGATAADLEGLGESVRERVFQSSGITLEWEIMRVGEPA